MKRNLYYFVYPRRGSIWFWNIQELKRYIEIFNGHKLCFVAVDKNTHRVDDVRSAFDGGGVEFVEVGNGQQWQTASFVNGLSLIKSVDDDEVTFYAHAKGVRYPDGPMLKNIQTWICAMLEFCLSDGTIIDKVVRTYPCLGALRKTDGWHGGSAWHYAGCFFWFKHSALFSRNWQDVHPDMYGVEGYLGRHFKLEESFDLSKHLSYSRHLYERGLDATAVRQARQALAFELNSL